MPARLNSLNLALHTATAHGSLLRQFTNLSDTATTQAADTQAIAEHLKSPNEVASGSLPLERTVQSVSRDPPPLQDPFPKRTCTARSPQMQAKLASELQNKMVQVQQMATACVQGECTQEEFEQCVRESKELAEQAALEASQPLVTLGVKQEPASPPKPAPIFIDGRPSVRHTTGQNIAEFFLPKQRANQIALAAVPQIQVQRHEPQTAPALPPTPVGIPQHQVQQHPPQTVTPPALPPTPACIPQHQVLQQTPQTVTPLPLPQGPPSTTVQLPAALTQVAGLEQPTSQSPPAILHFQLRSLRHNTKQTPALHPWLTLTFGNLVRMST